MNKLPLFLLFIFLIFSKINKTFAVDNVPSSSQTAKVTIASNSDTLTINSGITLGNLTTQNRANMGYEKKFSEKSIISFSLDAKNTNQYAKSVDANISLSSKF